LLIRSHEMKNEGYEETHDKQCVTIFSAPNYCDFSNNEGAWIRLRGNSMVPQYTKFAAVVLTPLCSRTRRSVRWPTQTPEACSERMII
jgi:hypothetical protein